MVESVDTPDLKSVEHYARGSSSLPAPIGWFETITTHTRERGDILHIDE